MQTNVEVEVQLYAILSSAPDCASGERHALWHTSAHKPPYLLTYTHIHTHTLVLMAVYFSFRF
jgi:hypothetical protein